VIIIGRNLQNKFLIELFVNAMINSA